jgi:hypothetical protein
VSDYRHALTELDEQSPEWHEARDRFWLEDPEGYRQWLDDEWAMDQAEQHRQIVPFDWRLWYDADGLQEWCDAYTCSNCGEAGVMFSAGHPDDLDSAFFTMRCCHCGAVLGPAPTPPPDVVQHVYEELDRLSEEAER